MSTTTEKASVSEKSSVSKKLMQARIRLQNTKLNKSGENKFAGYKYFELGDFMPTVNAIFNDVGLCGVVSFGTELATLTITCVDDQTHKIEITSPMAEANLKGCHPIQNLGAVETYTRRYLWVTAMEIVEHDVLDATTGQRDIKSTATAGAFESLTPELKEVVLEVAMQVADLALTDPSKAVKTFQEAVEGDNDLKVALWSRLDSKTRSIIKKNA